MKTNSAADLVEAKRLREVRDCAEQRHRTMEVTALSEGERIGALRDFLVAGEAYMRFTGVFAITDDLT